MNSHNFDYVIGTYNDDDVKLLQKSLNLRPLTARLLASRGITDPDRARALTDKQHVVLYDPFLLKDIDKAVQRIRTAIEQKQTVCIYGDYDVDGVTATTLLYTYLSDKGCKCSYFIPDRISEGYGLSAPVIQRLADKTDLIITVDTGITAIEEAAFAKQLGVDMIITDHHNCRSTLPDAVAVVNPHREDDEYPFKFLAGVGVVFKLLCALEGEYQSICDRYAEIVAIGTIADVMPLTGENRYIAQIGLAKLADTKYLGLTALMRHAGVIRNGHPKKVLSSTVGYMLAPRINAAGRIASASKAVELLLADNELDADRIAAELCNINKLRQATEQDIYDQAIIMIEKERLCGIERKFLVLRSDGWHQGVIGVVASRISERYGVPCVLFSFDGDMGKGSGRSIKGFSLMDALASCEDLLIEFGGHELAAGLSITKENFDLFAERINQYAIEHPVENSTSNIINVDCMASFDEITLDGITEIQLLEPFGLQNPQPLFLTEDLCITDITPLSAGKHVKLKLRPADSDDAHSLTALYFGMPASELAFCKGDICNAVYSVDINEYMGVSSPQITVKTLCYGDEMLKIKERGDMYYAKLRDASDRSDIPHDVMPALGDFRNIFMFLRHELKDGKKRFTNMSLYRSVTAKGYNSIDYCAMRVILDVLANEKLADITYINGETFDIDLCRTTKKVDLDSTKILNDIKSRHHFI